MKKAIIIGATSGIGKELAKLMVGSGYSVGSPSFAMVTIGDNDPTPTVNFASASQLKADVAVISDTNYQGSASGTLVINKATATVNLTNLSQTYDGTPKSATATTVPAGLTVNVTYTPASPVNARAAVWI